MYLRIDLSLIRFRLKKLTKFLILDMLNFLLKPKEKKMNYFFSKESFPLTLVVSLIVFSYLSIFSVLLFG